jgi:hypothetical protein
LIPISTPNRRYYLYDEGASFDLSDLCTNASGEKNATNNKLTATIANENVAADDNDV